MSEHVQALPPEGLRVSMDTGYARWLFLTYLPVFAVMMRGSLGGVLLGVLFGAVAYGWSVWIFTTPEVYILPGFLRVVEDGKERKIALARIEEVRETRWRWHTTITVTFNVSKSACEDLKFIQWLPANWPFDGRSIAQQLRTLARMRRQEHGI